MESETPLSLPERVMVSWMRASTYWGLAMARMEMLRAPELYHVRTEIGIPYGSHISHLADIYHPDIQPLGALIFYHGGGWAGGTRTFLEPLGRELASRGYLFITPGYRLIPSTTIQDSIDDVIQGWNWSLNYASAMGIGVENMALGGESAGSHLSTQALLKLALAGAELPRAHIAVFGPHDMQGFISRATPLVRKGMRVLRRPYSSLREAAPHLSNVNSEWPREVNLLTIHGDRDPLVPYRMSVALHEHARRHGARAKHLRVRGAPHGFINMPRSRFGWPSVQAIDRFLREVFEISERRGPASRGHPLLQSEA